MPLNIYTSNKTENLAQKLCENIALPLSCPLLPEICITQHTGTEHWLKTNLAEKQGVCANIRFNYPNAFIYDLLKLAAPELPEKSPFEPDILTWKIMKILPACLQKKDFRPLAAYLSDPSEIKLFQISKKIAGLFDRCIIFRPSMLKVWESGSLTRGSREEKWQAFLWRELIKETGSLHRAHLVENFFDRLNHSPETVKRLPERISIFGISSLPPFHLNFFSKISEQTRVDLFLLNPCREFWGDILSQKEVSGIIRTGIDPAEKYISQGQSLLASLGTTKKDFLNLLAGYDCIEQDLFQDIKETTLLSRLQSQILNLKTPDQKIPVDKEDTSIRIHCCHSPMREVEVLHDQLLLMFDKNRDLSPHDILIMTPDIDTYAPFIRAVFDSPENAGKKIPFSISDVSQFSENSIIADFLLLLDISRGRFGVTEVLPLLESASVQRKFSFSETDISLIKNWLAQTRVRWGIDHHSKQRFNLPQTPQNTWQAGLDRLLLGLALPGDGQTLFNGILPYDDIEGSGAQTLGRLISFTNKLFSAAKTLSAQKPLAGWTDDLIKILNTFFEPDDKNSPKMRTLREAVLDMENISSVSGFNRPVGLETIQEHLKILLKEKRTSAGFHTGAVTFCALESARCIPAKTIGLLGMNDNSFPRFSFEPGFNLMIQHPKPGDPSQKNEDRYLFLETLISASETLYISYTGQHIRDNTLIPPSVMISELADCLDETFDLPGKRVSEHLTTKHPLHPFSPAYFLKSGPLFSFSAENFKCAEKLYQPKNTAPPFIEQPLPLVNEKPSAIDIRDLSQFFANPSKYLLQHRLNLFLEIQEESFEDQENLTLKALEGYLFDQDLLHGISSGRSREELFETARANGLLPHGTAGEQEYRKSFDTVSGFLKSLTVHTRDCSPESRRLEIVLSDMTLTGHIASLYDNRLIRCRCAKIKPRDILTLWLEHLAAGLLIDRPSQDAILAGLGEKRKFEAWVYRRPDQTENILQDLMALYHSGLAQPLPFFPKASLTYAENIFKGKAPDIALRIAQNDLYGTEFSSGDLSDPYLNRCFKNSDFSSNLFTETAMRVYGPIIENRTKL